ncbi:hypothetical protein WJX74_006783 [Apatococcus lobatus]|uniref:Uncharacterized protein n=1 Tax=Apatococcus lobatus TaxID=904363 RepID=A0AAW1QUW2_9CHLO
MQARTGLGRSVEQKMTGKLPRLSYPFRAAELIDALPSYCEATTRIYQTYALLRAQSQMDPDKSLIQVVLIRSLHKGQTDNSGKAVLENTVCQQLSFTTPIHSDANPSHPRHHQPERMSCYTGQRRNSMWRPTRHCASGQHDGPCYIFLSACRLCEETGTCLELFVLQAPAANEESRTRECLSQPCSPLDTPLNFRFLLTLKPSSQSELTDANPFGHLGPSAQQDKEVGMKLLAISGQGIKHSIRSIVLMKASMRCIRIGTLAIRDSQTHPVSHVSLAAPSGCIFSHRSRRHARSGKCNLQQSLLHGMCKATRVNVPLKVAFVVIGMGVWGIVIAIWCGARELPGVPNGLMMVLPGR